MPRKVDGEIVCIVVGESDVDRNKCNCLKLYERFENDVVVCEQKAKPS